jgi:hypothetical protein
MRASVAEQQFDAPTDVDPTIVVLDDDGAIAPCR